MVVGFIGLGRMGSRIVMKLLSEGHEVVVWNRSSAPAEEIKLKIKNEKLKIARTIGELVQNLEKPRIIWVMVTAGEATEAVLDEVSKAIEKDDIIIDGGNAFYKDTQKRYKDFRSRGVRFLGIGVSGGLIAFDKGYPLMAGGDRSAYDHIKPILDSLSKPHGGHEYFGVGGAGHFVKMVHNGIEYGIMQSLGEGFGVLEKSPYNLDLLEVAKLWQKGTLVSGFLLDRTVDSLSKDPKLSNIVGYVGESTDGYAQYTVEQAKEEGVEVEIIERSLDFRRRSQKDPKVQQSFSAKLVAAIRQAFGGHRVRKKE